MEEENGTKKMIYNTVLSLGVYGLARCTKEDVKRVIGQQFCQMEVSAAKDDLFKSCKTIIGEKPERRDSHNRLVKEADIEDLVEGLVKMDGKENIKFVTDYTGLARLHDFVCGLGIGGGRKPQDDALEQQLKDLTKKVNANTAYISNLKKTNHSSHNMTTRRQGIPAASSNNGGTIKVPEVTTVSSEPARETAADIVKRNTTTHVTSSEHSTNTETTGVGSSTSDIVATIVNGVKIDVLSSTQNEPVPNEVINVDVKNKSGADRDGEDRRWHIVRGKGSGGAIQGPEKKKRRLRSVFVYNVRNTATVEKMKEHLDLYEIIYDDVILKSHNFSRFKSFKITVPFNMYDKILVSEIWDDGIMIRNFKEPRGDYY